MIVEAVRIVRDGLKDDAIGINQVLADLPRDEHDAPPPPVMAVLDVFTDAVVTAGELGVDFEFPPDSPTLIVAPFGAFTTEGEASMNQGKLDGTGAGVQVVYCTEEANLSRGMLHGAYTVRGVSQCMTLLFDNSQSARRVRNDIQLWSIRRRQWGPLVLRRGAGFITADFTAEFHTRDTAP